MSHNALCPSALITFFPLILAVALDLLTISLLFSPCKEASAYPVLRVPFVPVVPFFIFSPPTLSDLGPSKNPNNYRIPFLPLPFRHRVLQWRCLTPSPFFQIRLHLPKRFFPLNFLSLTVYLVVSNFFYYFPLSLFMVASKSRRRSFLSFFLIPVWFSRWPVFNFSKGNWEAESPWSSINELLLPPFLFSLFEGYWISWVFYLTVSISSLSMRELLSPLFFSFHLWLVGFSFPLRDFSTHFFHHSRPSPGL